MFNKYITNQVTRREHSSSLINITEKRAPTDESVELLKDMEKSALKNIIDIIDVKNNLFSGRIIKLAKIDMSVNFIVKMKINNKEISFEVNVPDYPDMDAQSQIEIFFENASKELLMILLKENPKVLYNEFNRSFRK